MTYNDLKIELQAQFDKTTGFSLEYNVELLSDSWKKNTADIVISNEDPLRCNFAILVATSSVVNVTYAKKLIKQMARDYGYWIGLLWNDGNLSYWIPEMDAEPLKPWPQFEIKDLMSMSIQFINSEVPKDYKALFLKNIKEYKPASKIEGEAKKVLSDWIRHLGKDDFEQQNRNISVDLNSQFELLRNLLKSDDIKPSFRFCRYASMEGIQRILLNKYESMCGLAGMNDKSEGFFLDKCLSNSSYNLYRKPQKQIDEFNKAFILSLCRDSKVDDLTMWRLYGCDGSGICLIYEVDLDKIRKSTEFILLPVSYGNISNKIVLLFKILSKLPYINGFKFGLSYKYIWQYFVKPDDFKVEEEYRLLYIPNDINNAKVKWILNGAYSIFHPLCEFSSPLFPIKDEDKKYTSFPLDLKEIVFGPKCPEAKTNKVQLRTYLSSAVSSPTLTESKIDFYR